MNNILVEMIFYTRLSKLTYETMKLNLSVPPPDGIAPAKVCALVSAVVVVNSRLFVTPNVEANRHFAAGRVWLKMK